MDERKELWKTIINFQKLAKSILSQREQLDRTGFDPGREKKMERLFQQERKINRVYRLVQTAKFTELEMAVLDNLLDGNTLIKTCEHLGISRSGGSKMLKWIIDKMLESES